MAVAKNRSMVEKLFDAVIEKAKQQGLSLLLLIAMTIIFGLKVRDLEQKSDACNARMIQILETTISNNNLMLQKNNELLLEIKFKLQTEKYSGN